jgi:hypothetical protein
LSRRLLVAAMVIVPIARGTAQRVQEVRAGVADTAAKKRLAPLASAIVPGTGQLMLGSERGIAYVAIEALAWWQFRKHVNERSAQEGAFKDLARRVARSHFAPNGGDGSWTYYEMMRDYVESGDFSTSDNGTVVPPTDTSTFNGHVWSDALRTHTSTSAALAQYEERAIRPDFQWSWKNARLQWDLFGQLTEKRNDANRAAARDLLLLAGNHLLSMVDAFATFRLHVRPAEGGGASLGASISW